MTNAEIESRDRFCDTEKEILLHQVRKFSLDICMARSLGKSAHKKYEEPLAVVKERYLQVLERGRLPSWGLHHLIQRRLLGELKLKFLFRHQKSLVVPQCVL